MLSGSSAGHTPDTAKVKSSRPLNDHSTLGPRLRHCVNSRMKASFSRHVLVMLLSTYWQKSYIINLEWINTVQWNHTNRQYTLRFRNKHRQCSHTDKSPTFSQPLPFMLCITVYLKAHCLLNRSLLLTEKFNDSCRALCISICYWQSFISLFSVFPHPASEG